MAAGERADAFDGAEQLMIAAELLVRADLLTDELFHACLFRAERNDGTLERRAHLGSDSLQAVLFGLQHEREFFSATYQSAQLYQFLQRRPPRSRAMSTEEIGNNGRVQSVAFIAIAGAASVLLHSPWIQYAHPMSASMQPQCQSMTVRTGGF